MADIMEGLRVISTESWGVVPAATAMLADMGADVIKIEPPGVGDYLRQVAMRDFEFDEPPDHHPVFFLYNRGKKAITLDVRQDEGREALLRLIETADVYTTNLRPGFLERHQLRYEDLAERNPRLVFASFNGYGEIGEERDRLALGPTALWSRAGFAAHYGEPDEAPHVDRPAWDDAMATLGFMNGLLAALYERERSGRGQKVAVSHYQVGVYINSALIQGRLAGARVIKKLPNRESPLRAFYECSDGRWVMISCLHDAHWVGVCQAFGREDLLDDARFTTPADRTASGDTLGAIMAAEFEKYDARTCMAMLSKAGTICEMAYEIDDIIEDPTAIENGFFVDVEAGAETRRTVNMPMVFSRTPTRPRGPAPEMGQNTEEVLVEAGYSWEEVLALREKGVL